MENKKLSKPFRVTSHHNWKIDTGIPSEYYIDFGNKEYAKQTADRVHKTYNCHDELVGALELFVSALTKHITTHDWPYPLIDIKELSGADSKARQALSRAKEE